jgi:hypothetical protein
VRATLTMLLMMNRFIFAPSHGQASASQRTARRKVVLMDLSMKSFRRDQLPTVIVSFSVELVSSRISPAGEG